MKYVFVAFIFIACTNISEKGESAGTGPKFSSEVLDTVKTLPITINATPVLFETAFIKGTTKKVNNSVFNLYGVTIGKIKIVSGQIIACDPLHIDEYGIPFTEVFPTGEFPVQLSIAGLDNEEAIAFARINFSDDPVERWEFALLKGQPTIPIGGKKIHGYSVDAGIGVFIDQEAKKALDKDQVTQMDGAVYKEMDRHTHYDWRYSIMILVSIT